VADAQRASSSAQCFVVGVEQRVFLKTPAFEWGGAGRDDGRARFEDAVKRQLDLALNLVGPIATTKASGPSD
jgi:hypothetical protein